VLEGTHDHGTDLVRFEVQRHAVDIAREFEELPGHAALQPVDLRDAVAYADHAPDVRGHHLPVEVTQALFDYLADLFGVDAQLSVPFLLIRQVAAVAKRRLSCWMRVRTLASTR